MDIKRMPTSKLIELYADESELRDWLRADGLIAPANASLDELFARVMSGDDARTQERVRTEIAAEIDRRVPHG